MAGHASLLDDLVIVPGDGARLEQRDPADLLGVASKDDGRERVDRLLDDLDALHDRLWAEAQRSVLVVLQGMDASGKDGAIRRVLTGLNPQGCMVVNFKAPTSRDLAHDYLWRIHEACPPRGILGVMNRSHYEDVVTARVIDVVGDEEVERRYRHIREFERMLTDEGTTVVKAFLHISKGEQRERLQARIDDPEKNWKFNRSDLETRQRWDDYQRRYDQALTATSTEWAPWYVVPADHKWVRDVAVSTLLLDVLERLDPRFPTPQEDLRGLVVE
jgi:PPK2 family polyphosphate:nucleotide phosphotransferase